MKARVGMGFDVHPFGGDEALVLGGITIDGPALVGHSDADAVAHAVADAVLGAAGLPDIGTLFPASDDAYRGVSSIDLLRDVAKSVRAAGGWIGNVDVVIAAARPALGTYVEVMSASLAEALRTAAAPMGGGVAVSVKAKHGEGMGAVGRGEGIAVWAVALVERS